MDEFGWVFGWVGGTGTKIIMFYFLLMLKISTTTKTTLWRGCVSWSDQTEQCSCYITTIAKNCAFN